MSMSRKFYEDIAARFKDLKPTRDGTVDIPESQIILWEAMVAETANSITAQGHTFDRQRFYEACGLITLRSGQ